MDRPAHPRSGSVDVNIVGFLELAQFCVLVAVCFLLLMAVSLCIAVIWQELRDRT